MPGTAPYVLHLDAQSVIEMYLNGLDQRRSENFEFYFQALNFSRVDESHNLTQNT